MKTLMAVVNDITFSTKIAGACEKIGINAVFTKSLLESIQKTRMIHPFLVVMDLGSPDSFELARALKRSADTNSIPIIGYADHAEKDVKSMAEKSGVDCVYSNGDFSSNMSIIFRKYSGK